MNSAAVKERNYKCLMLFLCMSRYFAVWVGEDSSECRRENRKKVTAIWAQNKIARLLSVEFINYYSSWCNNSTVHLVTVL